MYVCFPVSRGGRVRGYVVGLYDAGALVSAVAKGTALEQQRIAIVVDGHQAYDSGALARGAEESASADIPMANQVWKLELSVPLHYFREFRGLILSVVFVVGALIYSFVVLFTLSQRWSSALQRLNSTLESEVGERARAEVQIRDLNRELSRKLADFETLLDVIPIGIAAADGTECRRIRVNPALADVLGAPEEANISRKDAGGENSSYRIARNGRDLLPDVRPIRLPLRHGGAFSARKTKLCEKTAA
jgi:PAS domain-containing protein